MPPGFHTQNRIARLSLMPSSALFLLSGSGLLLTLLFANKHKIAEPNRERLLSPEISNTQFTLYPIFQFPQIKECEKQEKSCWIISHETKKAIQHVTQLGYKKSNTTFSTQLSEENSQQFDTIICSLIDIRHCQNPQRITILKLLLSKLTDDGILIIDNEVAQWMVPYSGIYFEKAKERHKEMPDAFIPKICDFKSLLEQLSNELRLSLYLSTSIYFDKNGKTRTRTMIALHPFENAAIISPQNYLRKEM